MPLSRSPSLANASAEIVLGHGPVERHPLARPFLQRLAKGGDRLFEPCRAALALARASLTRGRDRSGSWPSGAAPARASAPSAPRDRRRPPLRALPCRSRARPASLTRLPRLFWVMAQSSGTRSRVRSFSASRKAATASSSLAVPLSRSPSLANARPRLFWVMAQSSGTRSRVHSFSASR